MLKMPLDVFEILNTRTNAYYQTEAAVKLEPFATSYEQRGTLKTRASRILRALGANSLPHIFVSMFKGDPTHLPDVFSGRFERRVFDFIPKLEHITKYEKADKCKQSVLGSVGHLALEHDEKNAVIVQLQGSANFHEGDEPVDKDTRDQYLRWQEALIESAKLYCKENGLTLWMLHEKEYDHQYGPAKINIPAKYWPFRKKYALHAEPVTDPLYRKFKAFKIFEPESADD
ncbi:MAG TPA: hypothetical protein VI875_00680 [Candidatus Norongarragalinales archaeon]|nr:hypothetical protein [Candidatus Norongarragalinales archaeon]